MMSQRSEQKSLFAADTQYLEFVGRDGFYGFLAQHGRELFRDEDFAELYCPDNGRPSVPPSLLAMALLLQTHDRVSDAEATARAAYDLRWKVALGLEVDERPFVKSTLQLFRAQLVIHEQAQAMFRRSLEYARQTGYLQGRKLRVALDTAVILGRGAVEDTYNLLAHGIAQLCRALAAVAGQPTESWAQAQGLGRYFGSSIKGSGEVDWEEPTSREAFLSEIIQEGHRVLGLAREIRSTLAEDSEADQRISEAAELLTQLLRQDVEPTARGHRIRQGTSQDRIASVHDPEQRHGHKSSGSCFTGHKGAVAVEVESQLITGVAVLAGNAFDGDSAVALVEASEANTGSEVEQVIGDSAYGSMQVRKELGEREVIAPTVKSRGGRPIRKQDFAIDLSHDRVRCPEGHATSHWTWVSLRARRGEAQVRVQRFAFSPELCRACPRSADCIGNKRGRGRLITLHPEEERLQAARDFEGTAYFRQQYHQRMVVEHRIARLVQLGMRKSRFFGRTKTRFQLLLAATVANLTLMANATSSLALLRRFWASCAAVYRLRWLLNVLLVRQRRSQAQKPYHTPIHRATHQLLIPSTQTT